MAIQNLYKKVKRKTTDLFVKNRILSILEKKRLKNLARYQPDTIIFFGKKLKIVDSLTFLSSYHEIFEEEIYKFNTDKKDINIIDCGANIGLATIYFKTTFPDANITAFEPDPNIYQALKENINSFGYNNVICKNEAVSNIDAMLSFRQEGGHSGRITSEINVDTTQIKAIRLKSFLNNYENITFLKIDIEGEEIKVIPDIAYELKKVDYLFLEYHSSIDAPQKLDELLHSIKEAGMRYYIKEAANKPFPFICKEIFLKMDMLVNIFCYR